MLVRVVSKLEGLRGSIGGGLFTYYGSQSANQFRFAFLSAASLLLIFAAVVSSEGPQRGWLRRLRRRTLNSVTINQPSSAGLHHGDVADTLLAFYRSRAEMKRAKTVISTFHT